MYKNWLSFQAVEGSAVVKRLPSKGPLSKTASTNQHFVAVFVAWQVDILNDKLVNFPPTFVATKADILNETSGKFPAVFVTTTADILNDT